MSPSNQHDGRPDAAHDAASSGHSASYSDASFGSGVALRCQHCSHQSFRRSSLRTTDFTQIFFMRYPVRCLRCGQRQMVSFTVAGISLPAGVRHKTFENPTSKHWTEPHSHDSTAHDSPRNES
jgi:DNA-directed RNA polymerase subunit RPC12/RpoP